MKVSGCSGKLFTVSNSMRAGIAAVVASLLSTFNVVVMVVSKSDAVMVSWPELNSTRKWSKMGKVLFDWITPLTVWSARNNWPLDTINFILQSN